MFEQVKTQFLTHFTIWPCELQLKLWERAKRNEKLSSWKNIKTTYQCVRWSVNGYKVSIKLEKLIKWRKLLTKGVLPFCGFASYFSFWALIVLIDPLVRVKGQIFHPQRACSVKWCTGSVFLVCVCVCVCVCVWCVCGRGGGGRWREVQCLMCMHVYIVNTKLPEKGIYLSLLPSPLPPSPPLSPSPIVPPPSLSQQLLMSKDINSNINCPWYASQYKFTVLLSWLFR